MATKIAHIISLLNELQLKADSAEHYDRLAKQLLEKGKKNSLLDKNEEQNAIENSTSGKKEVLDPKSSSESYQRNINAAKKSSFSLDKICAGSDNKSKSYSSMLNQIKILNDAYTSKNYERAIELADIIMKQNCYNAVKTEKLLLERVPINSDSLFYPSHGEEDFLNGTRWYIGYKSFSRLLYNLDYDVIYPLHYFLQSLVIKGLSAIELSKYADTIEKSLAYREDADDCFNKAILFKHGIFQNPEENNLYISSYKYISDFLKPPNEKGTLEPLPAEIDEWGIIID